MRITTNTKLVERQSKIARYATFIGLGILLVSLISSFISLSSIVFSYLSLFIGLIFAYFGSTLANKWIREPRADHALEKALKGFDNKYHLYHYRLPAPHVLLAPTGLSVFKVKPLDGKIVCTNDRWKRTWQWGRILGGMGQEPLGNPSEELKKEIAATQSLLGEKFPSVPVDGYVIFTAPTVELEIENASAPVVRADGLKEMYRKTKRGPALPSEIIERVEKILDERVDAKTAK